MYQSTVPQWSQDAISTPNQLQKRRLSVETTFPTPVQRLDIVACTQRGSVIARNLLSVNQLESLCVANIVINIISSK